MGNEAEVIREKGQILFSGPSTIGLRLRKENVGKRTCPI